MKSKCIITQIRPRLNPCHTQLVTNPRHPLAAFSQHLARFCGELSGIIKQLRVLPAGTVLLWFFSRGVGQSWPTASCARSGTDRAPCVGNPLRIPSVCNGDSGYGVTSPTLPSMSKIKPVFCLRMNSRVSSTRFRMRNSSTSPRTARFVSAEPSFRVGRVSLA